MCALLLACLPGCGTTKQNSAKDQLLQSNAVDTAVARIDFTPLRGQNVYFDTAYLQDYKGVGFVNSAYVISSLRQQMTAAGLFLQEKPDQADFVVEGRIGTLGSDSHDMVYGIPATNGIAAASNAVSVFSGTPPVPGIPELSFARRSDQSAAAKLAVYAYERESKVRVWQSGISVGRATAKDSWFMGIGPFQGGSIYEGDTYFAGEALDKSHGKEERDGQNGPIAGYRKEAVFQYPNPAGRTRLSEEEQEENDQRVRPAAAGPGNDKN